jgi:hypothetical protein
METKISKMTRTTDRKEKTPAGNERFGVMAAGSPQKRQYGFESLYPAGSVVEAATTPSRHHVGSSLFSTLFFIKLIQEE